MTSFIPETKEEMLNAIIRLRTVVKMWGWNTPPVVDYRIGDEVFILEGVPSSRDNDCDRPGPSGRAEVWVVRGGLPIGVSHKAVSSPVWEPKCQIGERADNRAEYIAGELQDVCKENAYLSTENKSLQDEVAGLKFARDTLNEERRQLQNAVDVLKTKNHHLAAELYDRESRLSFIRIELTKISQEIGKWT